MPTDKYDLHTIDYSVQGWDTILASDMEQIDALIPTREIVILGETLAAYSAVCLKSDGKWYKAKADGTLQPAHGLVMEGGDATDEVRMQRMGIITNVAWSWTPGAAIYLDPATAGELTATAPLTNIQIIGYAISATVLLLTPLPLSISDSLMQTIWITANAMTPTASSGAEVGTTEYGTNDINMDYLVFDGTAEEFAAFQLPMPETWDKDTIKAKFYWSSATGSTAGDTVEWKLSGGALSNDDAIDAALGTAQVISDALLANNGTDLQVSGATPAITVGGSPALGDLVHFKVSRNVSGTDDMTEDAWLFGVWIQYKCREYVAVW